MNSLSIKGPVLATKVLYDGDEVAENVKISLPAVNFLTAEFQALGTMELPLPLTEALEATITSIGFDKGFGKLLGLDSNNFEFRFVVCETKKDGTSRKYGCKAFLKGVAKGIPGGDLEVGSNFEGDIPIAVTRYQLYVDGKETILIDKLKSILKINGKNYAEEITSLI
jgi:P2 family phage contractile tail tube protein